MGHKESIAVWGLIFRHKASKETENICGVCFVLLWFVNLEMGSYYVALADRSSLSRPNLELPAILLPLPTAFSDYCVASPCLTQEMTAPVFAFIFCFYTELQQISSNRVYKHIFNTCSVKRRSDKVILWKSYAKGKC